MGQEQQSHEAQDGLALPGTSVFRVFLDSQLAKSTRPDTRSPSPFFLALPRHQDTFLEQEQRKGIFNPSFPQTFLRRKKAVLSFPSLRRAQAYPGANVMKG